MEIKEAVKFLERISSDFTKDNAETAFKILFDFLKQNTDRLTDGQYRFIQDKQNALSNLADGNVKDDILFRQIYFANISEVIMLLKTM